MPGKTHQNTLSLSLYLEDMTAFPPLSLPQKRHLERLVGLAPTHAAKKEARMQLFYAYLPEVVTLASQFVQDDLALEDLLQEGNITLLHLAQTFSPHEKGSFRRAARRGIYQALCRVLRAHWRETLCDEFPLSYAPHDQAQSHPSLLTCLSKTSTRERTRPVSLQSVLSEEEAKRSSTSCWDTSVDTFVVKQARHDVLALGFQRLTLRERKVLHLRYGSPDTWTWERVGREIGVTQERARQIEQRALRKLRMPPLVHHLKEVLYLS